MRYGSMLKRQILLVSLSAILMTACKKDKGGDSGGDGYYVKFKLNGTEMQFKGMPYATFSVADDIYLGGFGASREQGVTENMMSVLVGSLENIKAGVTYTGLIHPPVTGGPTPAVFFSYIDAEGVTFANLYEDNAINIVTITSLDSKEVKGTFSGVMHKVVDPTSAAIPVSGDFFVKRIN